MGRFVRCRGKAFCVETADGCRTCGRSLDEIEATRSLVAHAAQFILEQGYDNPDEFTTYLADKIAKKVRHVRESELQSSVDRMG